MRPTVRPLLLCLLTFSCAEDAATVEDATFADVEETDAAPPQPDAAPPPDAGDELDAVARDVPVPPDAASPDGLLQDGALVDGALVDGALADGPRSDGPRPDGRTLDAAVPFDVQPFDAEPFDMERLEPDVPVVEPDAALSPEASIDGPPPPDPDAALPPEPDAAPPPEPDAAPPLDTCGDGVVQPPEVCDDGVNDALGGGCLPGCRLEDLSDEVFARELMEIEITMSPEDWEDMRHQRKTRHSIFEGEDCRLRQVPNPYTWFPGDITIDGVRIRRAGFRKKGHLGSLSTLKPGLKVRFDRFVEGQRFHTMAGFSLNNSKSDPSYVRQCLAYRTFAEAGVPAARCTYAHVTVNGLDKGVFVVVEEMKKAMLGRHFPDPDGNLYEGTACDFRPEFFGGFEQEINEDSDPSRQDLARVLQVVLDAPDDVLELALGEVVNLERFFRYWALEGLVWHRDGYSGNANNYYMFADPADGGRFTWLPWGVDAAWRLDNRNNVPDSVLAFGAIAFRLYQHPPTRQRYYQALDEVLDERFDPEGLVAHAQRMRAVLQPALPEAERASFRGEVDAVIDVVEGRRGVIEAVLADGQPAWVAGMRTLPCRIPVAPISGTLQTTWGTLADNIWNAGSGTIELTLDGQPLEVQRSGARIGRLGNGRGRADLYIETPDRKRLRAIITFPDPKFFDPYETPGDHELISPQLTTTTLWEDISDGVRRLGTYDIGEGTWTFEEVGTQAGDPVRVRFAGTLYRGVQ